MNNLYKSRSLDLNLNEERYKIAQWPEIRYHLDQFILKMLAPPNEVDDCFINNSHNLRLTQPLNTFTKRVVKEIWVAQMSIGFSGFGKRFYKDVMNTLCVGLEDLYNKLNQLSEPVVNPRKQPNVFNPLRGHTKSASTRRRLAYLVLPEKDLRTGIEGGGKNEIEFLLRLYQATVLWNKFAEETPIVFSIFECGCDLKDWGCEGKFEDHLQRMFWLIVLEPFKLSLRRMFRAIVLPEKWSMSKVVILKLKNVTDTICHYQNLFEQDNTTTPLITIHEVVNETIAQQ